MEERSGGKKRWVILVCICVVLAAAAVIGVLLIRNFSRKESYQAYVAQGQRYLEQEDYENAIAQFELALAENPDSEEAYVNLYYALTGAGYDIRAQLLLEKGVSKLGSARLELLLNRFLETKETDAGPEGETAELTQEEKSLRSGKTTLDVSALRKFQNYTFEEYEREYGTGAAEAEGEGCRVTYSDVGAVFHYGEDAMESTGEPAADAVPDRIEIEDLSLIFRNFRDVLLYDRLCSLMGRRANAADEGNGFVIRFTYRDLGLQLTCDENGNIGGDDTCLLTLPEQTDGEAEEVEGVVLDAVTGQGLDGAEILMTSAETGAEYEAESGSDGFYIIEIPDGTYELRISRDGYYDFEDEVTVEDGMLQEDQEFALSSELAEGEIRIVLTWGANPRDLDSHLVADSLSSRNHLYFGRSTLTSQGETLAELDLDDRNGYGPETTTIYNSGESYYFGVHRFAGTGSLSSSGAEVTIYMPGQNPVTVQVPQGDGDFWSVCRIENGQVNLINEITEEMPDWWD